MKGLHEVAFYLYQNLSQLNDLRIYYYSTLTIIPLSLKAKGKVR